MINHLINFNGELVPEDHPVMTIGNRGFKYGDGVFESMRLMKGEIKFLDWHIERLHAGMKALKLEGYPQLDVHFIKSKVNELVRRNKTGSNARIRLTVYRDASGLYTPTSNKFGYALEVSKIEENSYQNNARGLIVDLFDEVTKPVNALSNHKTCNSLVYVMAGLFKNQHALDEVLLVNQNGFLCEAMSANVFVVYDKQIYTPALSEGCISGVMRRVVMEIAKQNNLALIEAQINPAILEEADEVFITNASRGVQWVMGYGRKRYFYDVSKFLLDKLNSFK